MFRESQALPNERVVDVIVDDAAQPVVVAGMSFGACGQFQYPRMNALRSKPLSN
jgi:hypothetical protein